MSETKSRCKYCVRVETFVEGNSLTWACAAFHDIYNNNAIYKLRNRSGRMSEELARTLKAMAREIARLYESELPCGLEVCEFHEKIDDDIIGMAGYTGYWKARAEKAEAMVESLIEAGNTLYMAALPDGYRIGDSPTESEWADWDALVAEYRASKDGGVK